MNSPLVALLLHLVFFAIGTYMYLFSRGYIRSKEPEAQARAEAFRQENATWMRYLGLALAAVMLLNLFFDVQLLLA